MYVLGSIEELSTAVTTCVCVCVCESVCSIGHNRHSQGAPRRFGLSVSSWGAGMPPPARPLRSGPVVIATKKKCVCVFVCVWGDGVEIMSKSPGSAWGGGARPARLVAWGSVPSRGPLAKCSPRHTPGSRRVPTSQCIPFPCLRHLSVSDWPCKSASAGLQRGPQISHVSLSEFGPLRLVLD